MRVLLGVCGIGFGHSIRQLEIARHLELQGHDVRLFGFGNAVEFFSSKGFTIYDVWVPIVLGSPRGLNVLGSLRANFKSIVPGIVRDWSIIGELINTWPPDIVVSDYEPVSAYLAQKLLVPLITVDQQSKFRFFEFPDLRPFSPLEERKRLSLFFPNPTMSFIVSFYPIPHKCLSSGTIEVIPPILSDELASLSPSITPKLVVYFSHYLEQGIGQSYDEIFDLFAQCSGYTFHIFVPPSMAYSTQPRANVFLFNFNRERFLSELAGSCAVITTAGHTLLSEAFYLGKPALVIPLPTYDQHYCAEYLTKHGLGMQTTRITNRTLGTFLARLAEYSETISSSTAVIRERCTASWIVRRIESIHGRTRY